MLGEERREKILQRVRGLLREIDAEVHLHEVVLDSTREQLVFVMQKGEWPIVVGMNWLEYVSHRDEELKQRLAQSLQARLEAARQREKREEEV
jgi:predicted aspartyl protease